ncbi:MAG: DUF2628 domain-containing protein [Pseudomonadota bacterium]
MKSYTVHEAPNRPVDHIERAVRLKFVRGGFNWFAALLPPIWMLANGLWLVLVGYIVLATALQAAFTALEVGQAIQGAAALGFNLLIGFEADSLKRWTLARRGWNLVGSVGGRNYATCERRFLEAWLPAPAPREAMAGPPVDVAVAPAPGSEAPEARSDGDESSSEQPRTASSPTPPDRWTSVSPWRDGS